MSRTKHQQRLHYIQRQHMSWTHELMTFRIIVFEIIHHLDMTRDGPRNYCYSCISETPLWSTVQCVLYGLYVEPILHLSEALHVGLSLLSLGHLFLKPVVTQSKTITHLNNFERLLLVSTDATDKFWSLWKGKKSLLRVQGIGSRNV